MVDESAMTGSSAAVLREPGGESSPLLRDTRVVSGRILVRLRERTGRAPS
jgi:high-affinity K+ transport system ATPase subunit B